MRVGVKVAVLGAAATAGAALMAPGWASAAVENLQSGYWSQVPAGPQVPSGGIEVASDPKGPEAVAAIRFSLQPGVTPSTLTLAVSNAQPASQVAVIACPTSAASTSWQPPSGAGTFSDAPTADCSAGSVEGQLSADATTMTFALQDISVSSTVNIVLEPDQSPSPVGAAPGPSTTSPTFDITFDPVTPADVATTGTPTPTSTPATSSPGTGTEPAPSPVPTPSASPPPAQNSSALAAALPASSGLSSGTGVTPASPALAVGSAAAPAPSPADQAAPSLASPAPSNQVATPGSSSSGSSSPRGTSRDRWRIELALGIGLIDILALVAWQRFHPSAAAGVRPALTIYDPPPASVAAESGGSRAAPLGA